MKTFLLTLLIATTSVIFAQSNKEVEKARGTYIRAIQYNDPEVARVALYELITLEPSKIAWKDSLTSIYFLTGDYLSTVLVATEILKLGENSKVLEKKAIAEQQLGALKDALDSYEDLFKQTGEVQVLYQVATIQYQLKRFGECEVTLNALLNDTKTKEQKIVITVQKQRQEVPMIAAVLNMKGVMLKDLGKDAEAKNHFEKALEVSPEFVLAKGNLATMNVVDEPAPVSTPATPEEGKKKKKK